jgi:hypothetical protein
MPKLGPYSAFLDVVFFLYENRQDAERGTSSGATGFLVAVPSKRWPDRWHHIHGVTNWHVAVSGTLNSPPTPFIRVNRHVGKPEIFEFDVSEWIFKPGGPDIAISPPLRLTPDHKSMFLDLHSFAITPDQEKSDEIGPAEDVFMIGRFVDYDGIEANAPAVRFGHISIMDAKIRQPNGFSGRSIVIDMHSRTGFSGSPVFVYRTLGAHFLAPAQPGQFLTGGGHYMRLLGIHWGQFPESWELKKKDPIAVRPHASLITDGAYVEGLSGMTCVIPSAHIVDLINSPELVQMREDNEIERQKIIGESSTGPKAESVSPAVVPPATDANPNHRGDFMSLVNAAARKRTQGDQT